VRYFGIKGKPLEAEFMRTATPVGEKCMHCGEEIAPGDAGYYLPHVEPHMTIERPWHRACFLRGIIGSVAHQEKRCSCYGGTMEDDPTLTTRQAAEAAFRHWEKNR
jgi:hypothetical protein